MSLAPFEKNVAPHLPASQPPPLPIPSFEIKILTELLKPSITRNSVRKKAEINVIYTHVWFLYVHVYKVHLIPPITPQPLSISGFTPGERLMERERVTKNMAYTCR